MSLMAVVGVALASGIAFLAALFLRRLFISRTGAVELSVRLYRVRRGRGWSLGLARFAGDRLLWYRMFSLSPRPCRILRRQDLTVVQRRAPHIPENVALLSDSVILECETECGPVELAMNTAALTGFLSWLEAAAPGPPPYVSP